MATRKRNAANNRDAEGKYLNFPSPVALPMVSELDQTMPTDFKNQFNKCVKLPLINMFGSETGSARAMHDIRSPCQGNNSVRVMVSPDLILTTPHRYLQASEDLKRGHRVVVDVKLPKQLWSKANARGFRQALMAQAPLRPEVPFHLSGGGISSSEELKLNSPRGDAPLVACGVSAGAVLTCNPDDQQHQAWEEIGQQVQRYKAVNKMTPKERPPSSSSQTSAKVSHLPRSPRSSLSKLQFERDLKGTPVVMRFLDCDANQYSLGAVSACTGELS
jgi:hypothetical protein